MQKCFEEKKANYREVEIGDNRNLTTPPFLHSWLRNDPLLPCPAFSVSDLKADRLYRIFVLLHEPEIEAAVQLDTFLCLQEKENEKFK